MRAHATPANLTRAALALAAAAAVAAPAAAQTYAYETPAVGEVVVTGALGYDGRPARLSRAVSFRDLDLTTSQDRAVLRMRIRDTARDLCRALSEDGGATPLIPSCADQALRETSPQLRVAINQARRTYASLEATDPYAPMPYPY